MVLKFAERLKELRTERGLTYQQLSKELGGKVSTAAIGHWELSKRLPRIDVVALLAVYFNVSSDYLIGLED